MYHLLFGMNPAADALLGCLGLSRDDFGRFRDVWCKAGEICVYTRVGGGNRPYYRGVFEKLRQHPCYVRNEDDDFDDTYCTFYFRYPEAYRERLAVLEHPDTPDGDTRWQLAWDALRGELGGGGTTQ